MSTIGEDLIDFLTTATSITLKIDNRVHQGHMPHTSTYPAIWFQRSAQSEPAVLDRTRDALKQHRFDVECLDTNINDAIELSGDVHELLHTHLGTFGGRTVQGIFVEDKDDDYIPRNDATDDGVQVSSLDVVIWST